MGDGMTREQAIRELEGIKKGYEALKEHDVRNGTFMCGELQGKWRVDTPQDDLYNRLINACSMAIEALEKEPCEDCIRKKRWIPIKTRPMTDEEKKYYARFGFDVDSDEATMIESKMPDDGQKVWVCSDHGYVWQDTCEYDGGTYSLEENGDWLDIVAWMPFDEPEPYKAESEE